MDEGIGCWREECGKKMDVRLEKVNQSGVSSTFLHIFHFITFFLPLSQLYLLFLLFSPVSSKPLKKLGNSFFLFSHRRMSSGALFFHLHLTILLISSSSNWILSEKPCGVTSTWPSCLPSFPSYSVCRFVHSS